MLGATVVAFAACNVSGTLLSIWTSAPADVFGMYVANAEWWDAVSIITLGSLLFAILSVLHANARLGEQRAAAQRAEELRVRAELQALRARLDPHFLFNTLHSIQALVRSDAGSAEEALETFGALLRYVLETERDARDEVTLEEELAFIRSYLALERLRLGARLRVVEEVQDDALECRVLALTLQPLVENAVRHGIAPRAKGGTLRLAARVEGERIEIVVGDDGQGGDPRSLAAADGLGFRVVQQRLQARYGEAARVDVTAAPQEGWVVRLTLPVVVSAAARRVSRAPAVRA
jgi:LytS/YehU family sensor histidine kinase